MSFTVVAKMNDVLIYNRAASASDAQKFASERHIRGASSVRVYDRAWSFLGASALKTAAATQNAEGVDEKRNSSSSRPAVTFKV